MIQQKESLIDICAQYWKQSVGISCQSLMLQRVSSESVKLMFYIIRLNTEVHRALSYPTLNILSHYWS